MVEWCASGVRGACGGPRARPGGTGPSGAGGGRSADRAAVTGGPSRRVVPKMCQSCHVPAVSTYRTADRRERRDRDIGKGQLG